MSIQGSKNKKAPVVKPGSSKESEKSKEDEIGISIIKNGSTRISSKEDLKAFLKSGWEKVGK